MYKSMKYMTSLFLISLYLISILDPYCIACSEDELRYPLLCSREQIDQGRRRFSKTILLVLAILPIAEALPPQPEIAQAFLSRDTMLKLGFASNKIDSIYARFSSDKKLRRIMETFQKGMDAIEGLKGDQDKYAAKLLELSKKVFLELKNKGYLFDLDKPDSLMKLLANAVSPDRDIFEIIQNNQGLAPEGKQLLINEITKCSPRSQLAIMFLKTRLNSNLEVKGAISPNHSFSVIDMGGNRYLFIDFSLGLFMDIKLDMVYDNTHVNQKPEYIDIGRYWFLRNAFKLSLKKMNLFKKAFAEGKTDRLIELYNPTKEELLAFFYPTIHIIESNPANGFASSSAGAIHISRGHAFSLLGDSFRDYSLAESNRVIEIDPFYAGGYTNKGEALLADGKYEEAIRVLEKAKDIDPTSAITHLNLGTAYGSSGRWNEAIIEYGTVIAAGDNDRVIAAGYDGLGKSYLKKFQYNDAIRVFRAGVEKIPADFHLHYGLGMAYFGDGKYKEAADAFKEAININHNSWEPWLSLGMSYYNMPGKREEAIKSFIKAVTLAEERDKVIEKIPADIVKDVMDGAPLKVSRKALPPLCVGIRVIASSL